MQHLDKLFFGEIPTDETKSSLVFYSMAERFTPIFWSLDYPDHFGRKDRKITKDEWDQIPSTETILLPWSIIKWIAIVHDGVIKILTNEYKSNYPLYTDICFLGNISTEELPERNISLPPTDVILSKLRSQVDKPYIWWGNSPDPIVEMLQYNENPNKDDYDKITLNWFDCSGLLYWATDGYTPRNTSELMNFWECVEIEWKNTDEILTSLKPLDIIVWQDYWHCMIVLDNDEVIESTVSWQPGEIYTKNNGVRIRKIWETLEQLIYGTHPRIPKNTYIKKSSPDNTFYIRRWLSI
jgi:hypothetical protein